MTTKITFLYTIILNMPTAKKTTGNSQTLGDVAQKFSKIKTSQLVYTLLLAAVFLVGYLLARVQLLEKGAGTNNNAPAAQQQAQQPQQQGQAQAPVKADVRNGHFPVLGKESAKITIVEFSDFQCPFCSRFFKESFPQIKKEYIDTGKAKLYFRHFPLDFHPAATPAALASECANEQNKFWEYHDKLFNEQEKISVQGQTPDQIKTQLKTWAQELSLNTTQFNSCLDSEKYKNNVTTDTADGKTAGVSGTPTFYINGTQLVGAQPFASFKTALDAAK